MNGLSISKRLMLAFGFMAFLFMLFGGYAIYAARSLNDSTGEINDWMRCVTVLADMENHVNGVRRATLRQSIIADRAEQDALRREIETERSAMDSAFADYDKILADSDYEGRPEEEAADKADLQAMKDLWRDYTATVEHYESLLAQGDADGARAFLLGESEAAFADIHAAVVSDSAGSSEGTEEAVAASNDMYGRVITVSIISLLVVLTLGAVIILRLTGSIKFSVQEILRVSGMVADGDVSRQIQLDTSDEFGEIARYFNVMMQKVNAMVRQIQSISHQVAAAAEELTASSDQSAESTKSIAASVGEVAASAAQQTKQMVDADAAVQSFAESVAKLSEALDSVIGNIEDTVKKAQEGNTLASGTVKEMNDVADAVVSSSERVEKLGDRSKEIGNIVELISSIAGQTTLLALNAAIEAARAGEHGRGFAVVAQEIGKLAAESQEAAQKIGEIITGIQAETDGAVKAMRDGAHAAEAGKEHLTATGESFGGILAMINQVQESAHVIKQTIQTLEVPMMNMIDITDAVNREAQTVSDKAQTVSSATEQQSTGVAEIAACSRALSEHAQNLQDTALKFKV